MVAYEVLWCPDRVFPWSVGSVSIGFRRLVSSRPPLGASVREHCLVLVETGVGTDANGKYWKTRYTYGTTTRKVNEECSYSVIIRVSLVSVSL